MLNTYAIAIVFLPLLGFLLAGVPVRVIPARLAEIVTCVPMLIAAVLAGMLFWQLWHNGAAGFEVPLAEWISIGNFRADWVIRVDMLTAVMLIVVTWVSTVVHIYSVGYMHHDEHRQRFMAYLSLFTFCMLMLVTADNFLQLFLGWEGVGLASYLLIGFWFHKDSANAAAIKAFVVNRVGDFGMVLGVMAVYLTFGSIEFDSVFAAAPSKIGASMHFFWFDAPALSIIAMLLFVGCMGKSAQLGLHTWLPDAMEGPTPVSALIHAATMVTAGVFLVARCSPIFELAPDILVVVTVIGACTAVFAATIGLVQNDIKRVIAYSTCSQLGYMFFACGVGAYGAAVFHLMTHAFFKALLFLGSGSVIHGMNGEQDMRKMGGIWKKLPVTYGYMWLGSLALAGIPMFAGFYSKDAILESAFAAHTGAGQFAYWMGIFAAFMTAFYSWRLLFMTFHGKTRADHHTFEHAHESPAIMNLPLVLLAVGSLLAGWLGFHVLGMVDGGKDFWKGAIKYGADNKIIESMHHVPAWVANTPLVVAVSGIVLAYILYISLPKIPPMIAARMSFVHRLLLNKWYVDEIYNLLFVRTAFMKGGFLWRVFDARIIDGLGPNGMAAVSRWIGRASSMLQTGYVFHYGLAMIVGLMAMLGWLCFLLIR